MQNMHKLHVNTAIYNEKRIIMSDNSPRNYFPGIFISHNYRPMGRCLRRVYPICTFINRFSHLRAISARFKCHLPRKYVEFIEKQNEICPIKIYLIKIRAIKILPIKMYP